MPRPVVAETRLETLDLLRGVALCGILLMNITGFGGPPYTYADPTNGGWSTDADLWTWITTTLLFEGTQRGLFTILFGAGIVLLTRSLEASGRIDAIDVYFRRNLWLVVFGMVHAFVLLWEGEILFFYGVSALFVFGLRHARRRTLIGIAVAGLAVTTAWSGIDTVVNLKKHAAFVAADSLRLRGDSLSKSQQEAVEAWTGVVSGMRPDSAKIQKEITAKRGSYWDVMKFQAPGVVRFESWFLYRYFFDYFGMMLLGIALFRSGVFGRDAPRRWLWTMTIVGYAIGLGVNTYEMLLVLGSNFSPISFIQADLTYNVGRIPLTFGHLGLLLLFARSEYFGWIKRRLAAVGRMAFTNYIMHSVICGFFFLGFGLGWYGHFDRHELYYVVGAIWALQLIVSPIWLRHFRFGPLEWVWRWLSYGERPKFRGGAITE